MTAKKKPEDKKPRGAPSKYRPEYCQMLIDHMANGDPLNTFTLKVNVSVDTLYEWRSAHPDFSEACKVGRLKIEEYYIRMAKTMAAGQLRRVKSERVRVGSDGKPLFDQDGNVIYDREYEAATPAQAVFIFLTKNLLKWHDKQSIEHTGPDGGSIKFANMTKPELEARVKELVAKAKQK